MLLLHMTAIQVRRGRGRKEKGERKKWGKQLFLFGISHIIEVSTCGDYDGGWDEASDSCTCRRRPENNHSFIKYKSRSVVRARSAWPRCARQPNQPRNVVNKKRVWEWGKNNSRCSCVAHSSQCMTMLVESRPRSWGYYPTRDCVYFTRRVTIGKQTSPSI